MRRRHRQASQAGRRVLRCPLLYKKTRARPTARSHRSSSTPSAWASTTRRRGPSSDPVFALIGARRRRTPIELFGLYGLEGLASEGPAPSVRRPSLLGGSTGGAKKKNITNKDPRPADRGRGFLLHRERRQGRPGGCDVRWHRRFRGFFLLLHSAATANAQGAAIGLAGGVGL